MYKAADMSLWDGRTDEDDNSLRWHQCVRPYEAESPGGVVLLGIACDEGVKRNQGRVGAAGGPDAIRRVLGGQAFHLRRPVYDGGNLFCEADGLEALQQEQTEVVKDILDRGHFPLILGGGHEIAFGNFAGLEQHLKASGDSQPVGVINFDAHFDLRREAIPTSGTPFLQIAEYCETERIPFRYLCLGISETANTAALFDRAGQLGADYVRDEDCWDKAAVKERVERFLAPCRALYLSIDLDVLPAASAPGVSAPAAAGVPMAELERLLSIVRSMAGERLKLADIAEYNPDFDVDGRTARVAARLCHLLTRPYEIDSFRR